MGEESPDFRKSEMNLAERARSNIDSVIDKELESFTQDKDTILSHIEQGLYEMLEKCVEAIGLGNRFNLLVDPGSGFRCEKNPTDVSKQLVGVDNIRIGQAPLITSTEIDERIKRVITGEFPESKAENAKNRVEKIEFPTPTFWIYHGVGLGSDMPCFLIKKGLQTLVLSNHVHNYTKGHLEGTSRDFLVDDWIDYHHPEELDYSFLGKGSLNLVDPLSSLDGLNHKWDWMEGDHNYQISHHSVNPDLCFRGRAHLGYVQVADRKHGVEGLEGKPPEPRMRTGIVMPLHQNESPHYHRHGEGNLTTWSISW